MSNVVRLHDLDQAASGSGIDIYDVFDRKPGLSHELMPG